MTATETDELLPRSHAASPPAGRAQRFGRAVLPYQSRKLRKASYYVPAIEWIPHYSVKLFFGDFVAGLSVACFSVPLSLSYASGLAQVPPIHGLYAYTIPPLIYAFLGSCPCLIIGPEAAISLIMGQAIRQFTVPSGTGAQIGYEQALVGALITFLAGFIVFIAGVLRLGFLDAMLGRSLLRGFLYGVGIVIMVDQLLPELGLMNAAVEAGAAHQSGLDKLIFILQNTEKIHALTASVAFTSIAVLLVVRYCKSKLMNRYPSAVYFPEILIVVIATAFLCNLFNWDKQGLEVLGTIRQGHMHIELPLSSRHLSYVRRVFPTSFAVAMLGFFESEAAAKTLGTNYDINISSNRELVALGFANIVGSTIGALPAFGGYARSKINIRAGANTPMSSIVLSVLTIASVFVLLPSFYYLPKCVLSSIITVAAMSLLEMDDVVFFWKLRSHQDLGLMLAIFLLALVYSLEMGIAVGVGVSLILVIKHSTHPRISILGRVNGTHSFKSAEETVGGEEFEDIDRHTLLVKIPEPLTFANTGELRNRLRRLELYGTDHDRIHPSEPRLRDDSRNKRVVFDLHGATTIDASAIQILYEIAKNYRASDTEVYFTRVRKSTEIWTRFEHSGLLDLVGGTAHVLDQLDDLLDDDRT